MGRWKISAFLAVLAGGAAIVVAFTVAESNGRVVGLGLAAITLALLSLME